MRLNMDFHLIVISPPAIQAGESETAARLFGQGLETFHLRKPESSLAEMEMYLSSLSPEHQNKVVIHSHYELALRYPVRGIHLNENWLGAKLPTRFRGKNTSYSIHSLAALKKLKPNTDYAFLSPVFDSISKPGYKSAIDLEEASTVLKKKNRDFPGKVIALGGISEKNILKVKETGFDGAAVLGSIWSGKDPLKNFELLRSKLLQSVT